jgi:ABC-2 type transport system ATP-binding protein
MPVPTATRPPTVLPRHLGPGSIARPTAVRIDHATHDFGEGSGVFDLNLEIEIGTIVGVVGPSGAGKTTTIRMITGALEPSSGEVTVLGETPHRFSRHAREQIGYMPQQFSLYPDLSVAENVDFVASLFGMLFLRRRRRVREVLELVELASVRRRRAGRLSGGMQRRLDLACALVHEPRLLVLDEPTAGVDPILRQTIWRELHRLREEGRTIVVTTQYLSEVEHCDRVALISDGHLAASGSSLSLRRQAAGGDILEGRTAAPFDPTPLAAQAGIRDARSLGLRTFRVITDDAGSTASRLPDLVEAAGGRLESVREATMSFDEVFTRLVNGHGHDSNEAAADDAHALAGAVATDGVDAARHADGRDVSRGGSR